MTTIGIIGFGIVGKSVHHAFKGMCDFKIYDINPNISQNSLLETVEHSDYLYICVPTPMKKNGEFDSSILDQVIDSITHYACGNGKIIIIKSTVVPGTTQEYIDKYPNVNIINCPEFLREATYIEDALNPSRIILGVPDKLLMMYVETPPEIMAFQNLQRLYEERFPGIKLYITNPTTAEMVKYTSNCFLATKVSFFNEIYDICNELGVDYSLMIDMVLADGRIGRSHYTVPGHDGERGFGGLCFPKDMNALIKKSIELGVSPIVLLSAWNKNLNIRKDKDWEKRDGAIST